MGSSMNLSAVNQLFGHIPLKFASCIIRKSTDACMPIGMIPQRAVCCCAQAQYGVMMSMRLWCYFQCALFTQHALLHSISCDILLPFPKEQLCFDSLSEV